MCQLRSIHQAGHGRITSPHFKQSTCLSDWLYSLYSFCYFLIYILDFFTIIISFYSALVIIIKATVIFLSIFLKVCFCGSNYLVFCSQFSFLLNYLFKKNWIQINRITFNFVKYKSTNVTILTKPSQCFNAFLLGLLYTFILLFLYGYEFYLCLFILGIQWMSTVILALVCLYFSCLHMWDALNVIS